MLWIDFALIAIVATIAKHNSCSQFFIQHHAIDVVQIGNIVKICDVNDVISMQSIFNIYSLRICSSSNQLKVPSLDFLFSFLISSWSELVDITDINLACSDSCNWTLMYFVHYCGDPSLVICDQFRCPRSYFFVFWEQQGHITISSLNKSTCKSVMLKSIIFCIHRKSCLEASHLACLCLFKNALLVRVRQISLVVALIVFKHIMFHCFISSFGIIIVFGLTIFYSMSDKRICCGFLFFSKSVENFFDSFFAVVSIFFTLILFFRIFFIIRMFEIAHNHLVITNNDTCTFAITMSKHIINECSWICTGKDQTYFSNHTVNNITSSLFKLICENRQRTHITVPNKFFSGLTCFSVVKLAMCVNPIISIFQVCKSKNIIWCIMVVHPD